MRWSTGSANAPTGPARFRGGAQQSDSGSRGYPVRTPRPGRTPAGGFGGRDRIRQSRECADEGARCSGGCRGDDCHAACCACWTGLKHHLVLVALRAGPGRDRMGVIGLGGPPVQWFDPSTDPREDGNLLLGDIERQLATVVVDRQELNEGHRQPDDEVPGAQRCSRRTGIWSRCRFFGRSTGLVTPGLPKAISGMRSATGGNLRGRSSQSADAADLARARW